QVMHHGSIAPSELEVELQMHHLMFMPTLGENFGHAIIESMAAGCPVLISDQTPWKDLEPDAGGWALPVEDKSAFIKCLSHCVELGQGEFDRMSVGAWRYAKMCCNDRQVTQKYIQLFSNH
ncbi:MAG: glycosyltransferase, partial [Flavobacteriales bacterium]